jgi:hypothetical protein
LVGLAAIRDAGLTGAALWVTLGIGAVVAGGYAAFLAREYRRNRAAAAGDAGREP